MLHKFLLLVLIIPQLILGQTRHYKVSPEAQEKALSGKIVVKTSQVFDANVRQDNTLNLSKIAGVLKTEQVRKPSNSSRSQPSILDGVYWVYISTEVDPIKFCNELLKYPEVIYAEVLFEEQLLDVPNDPFANPDSGSQGYLSVIKAYDAWNITHGSDQIVIGIVDTGMDFLHEDLAENVFINTGELPEANGIDDDGNGYIDDIHGYDFADNDTNPTSDGNQHGTHVSGLAGASTNNGIGIAGVGYSTKIAALKGFTTIGSVSTGVWEGVLYAAENGYDIANLSWGNFNNFSQFYQDLIDYCVLEKDMVIIAAAGNTNADLDFYPASYENVLSVAGTTGSDTKWSSGTYSHNVDITAPAQNIFSTQKNNTYNTDSGSSHASPQVAGAAALVKSVFTQYNARQIMEQLRVTSDDIYSVGSNSSYMYKLGKGRLNAFRAVTESNSRSLRVHNTSYSNGLVNKAFFGDTLSFQFDLINYLAGLNSPSVSLVSASPFATILTPVVQPGSFSTMQTKMGNEIRVLIDESTPPDTEINLRFTMSEGSYSDFQNISIRTEPNNFDFGNGNLLLKVSGEGNLCYLDANLSNGYEMAYNNLPVLKFTGLLIADGSGSVQDNVINKYSIPRTRDADFQGGKSLKLKSHETLPYYGYSEFSSKNGDFWVEQSIIPSLDKSYLILSYRIVNTSGNTKTDVTTGFFADYFLANQTDNHAQWDAETNSLIFYDHAEKTFGALKMLEDSYHYAALDMQAVNGNVRDVFDAFTDANKFNYLTNADIPTAGTEGIGNDVAGLVSSTQSILGVGEEMQIAFVLAMGDSYSELATNLEDANENYLQYLSHPPLLETMYSCVGNDVIANPKSGINFSFYQDPLAQTFLGTANQFTVTNITQDTAIYVRNLDGAFSSSVRKLQIRLLDKIADFTQSTDTLYLDHPTVNTISFKDASFQASSWLWNFDNNTTATIANPIMNFSEVGTYTISLNVTSAVGCSDQISKDIVVANRPATPVLQTNYRVCRNEVIPLVHPTDVYVVYDYSGNQIGKGNSLEIGPFDENTTLFIAQRINQFESLSVEIFIAVNELDASYSVSPDLSSNTTKATFTSTAIGATSFQWKINGQSVSSSSSFSISADGNPLNIELIVSNEVCEETFSETITFSPSPIPFIENLFVCSGDDVNLAPTNGTYFGFYEDQALTQLISKGQNLTIQNLASDQTIYIVGLDNILPSIAQPVSMEVSDFNTTIAADPYHVVLSQSKIAKFSSTEQIIEAKWFVNEELVETALSPTILFTTPGLYEIKLVGINQAGCTTTTSLLFEVLATITGLDEVSAFSIYPNPVRRGNSVVISSAINEASLYGIDGQLILKYKSADSITIPSNIEAGLYILSFKSGDQLQQIKLLVH